MNKLYAIPAVFTMALLVVGVIVLSQNVSAQVALGGVKFGSKTGTASAAVSTTIAMPGGNKYLTAIYTASGGNFGSKFGLISVSVDNSNFILIDNVTLSTNTKVAKMYDDGHLGTTVAVNPALFPYVKIETSAGNSGVTEKVTWTTIRGY